jgi:hypothetical protein
LDTPNVYQRIIHRSEHHSTFQEWFEIKTCGKCGKANDVMRKYCTRCGASLLRTEEAATPKPVKELEEEPVAETTGFSEARHVLPSEVASEQAKMKSEQAMETPPTEEEYEEYEDEEYEDEVVSESTEMDHDRGREVVKDILEKVKAAEARSRGEEVAVSSETDLEPPPEAPSEEIIEEIEAPDAYEEPEEEDEVYEVEEEGPLADEIEFLPQEEIPIEEPVPVAPVSVAPPSVTPAFDEPVRDEKIRTLEGDIKTFNIERGQLQSELDKLHARLDEEVERYLVVAETKRTRAESLERELKLAKNEYNDASKEHKNAENRRKKELSNAEKRIQDVDKRIKKAEDAREKRIQDLEKERLKREEEAKR